MLYLLTAGKKALEDGGISPEVMNELDKAKCGILIGSALGGMKVCHLFLFFIYNQCCMMVLKSLISRFSMMQ